MVCLVIKTDHDDLFDSWCLGKYVQDSFHGQLTGQFDGKAVNSGTDSRECNVFQVMICRQ